MSRKMMLVTFMVLPFLAARPVLAQDTHPETGSWESARDRP